MNRRYALRALWFLIAVWSPCYLISYELVVASMFRDEGNYLKEWVEYHQMVGVDHFWLYNNMSTDNWREVLQPYIDSGLVEVFDWPTSIFFQPPVELNTQDAAELSAKAYGAFHQTAQLCAFGNALRKGVGSATWVAFIDIDEFILPMQDQTIPECLNNHFQDAQAVYANWRCFGTGGIYVPKTEPLLSNLTACSLTYHSRNSVGKSIIRPEWANVDALYGPHCCALLNNGLYLNGDARPLPTPDGPRIKTDGLHHSKFIRINHYIMRDEEYFQNVRLKRAREGYAGYVFADVELLLQQNKEFSIVKDYAIIKLIKKYYPEMYEPLWK